MRRVLSFILCCIGWSSLCAQSLWFRTIDLPESDEELCADGVVFDQNGLANLYCGNNLLLFDGVRFDNVRTSSAVKKPHGMSIESGKFYPKGSQRIGSLCRLVHDLGAPITAIQSQEQPQMSWVGTAGKGMFGLEVWFGSNLTQIEPTQVRIKTADGNEQCLTNDRVFIFAGGELPTQFLEKTGVQVTKRFGYTVRKHK